MSDRPRIALVIGSGGIKCASAVGLWKVFHNEGIPIDMLVGCSGGSLFAATIAMGWDAEALEQTTLDLWSNGITGKLDYKSVLQAIFPKLLGFKEQFGLVDDNRINNALKKIYNDLDLEDLPIPLHLVATDVHTGDRVVLSSGKVRNAVRASMAIPVIFRPWLIDGRLLFDGGVSDPLPISVAIREGSDIIIAMGFENPRQDRIRSTIGLFSQTLALMVNNLLRATYAFYNIAHHAEVVPILPAFDRKIELNDTDQIPYLIECGEQAAREQLPYLRRLIASQTKE